MNAVLDSSMISIPDDCGAEAARRGLSAMAQAMAPSSILTIANEIRALKEKGVEVADLTVGDFSPTEFPIPEGLRDRLAAAIGRGETNYPPPAGMTELRLAVRDHVRRTQGLDYPLDSFAIVGGGRPALYATYRLLVDPGDLVVFPVPSWNNHNYRDVCQVRVETVDCRVEDAFQPTAARLAPHLTEARLLVLNTPQNPSGGVMPEAELAAFGELLVAENARRQRHGGKPLYLLFDQIYRSTTFGKHRHASPVQMVPECAPFVVHMDGISKGCCATGLRCGWMFAPPTITRKAVALLTHVGAWAPKPVQTATAAWLADEEAVDAWDRHLTAEVQQRLEVLSHGMQALKAQGYPVDYIDPQGAIYLSVRFDLVGRTTPDGQRLQNNEDIRAYLLRQAAFALVPFSAFGADRADAEGWSRASVGAISAEQLTEALERLRAALDALN